MTKKDALKNLNINMITNTVFIRNQWINFSYTAANDVVKDEFKDQYRYFGGLQCEYAEDTEDYKNLEKWLCEISEFLLKYTKQ